MSLSVIISARNDEARNLEELREQADAYERHVQRVLAVRRARRRRSQFFAVELFSDPAWDMLLELYVAELEQRRMSITGLADSARVAATTGLRWIDTFEREGLVTRRSDPLDARRTYIRLSANGAMAMRAYFSSEANAIPEADVR
jgi:DNA-binding MarR family transcriptional regulator